MASARSPPTARWTPAARTVVNEAVRTGNTSALRLVDIGDGLIAYWGDLFGESPSMVRIGEDGRVDGDPVALPLTYRPRAMLWDGEALVTADVDPGESRSMRMVRLSTGGEELASLTIPGEPGRIYVYEVMRADDGFVVLAPAPHVHRSVVAPDLSSATPCVRGALTDTRTFSFAAAHADGDELAVWSELAFSRHDVAASLASPADAAPARVVLRPDEPPRGSTGAPYYSVDRRADGRWVVAWLSRDGTDDVGRVAQLDCATP